MAALNINPALSTAAFLTIGVSPEAQALQEEIRENPGGTVAEPFSFQSPSDRLLAELMDLWSECRSDDWDGYGARGLASEAVQRAFAFMNALPAGVELPELSAMPNGDVALDWDFAPRRTITVTVAASPRLAYAAIDGDEEWSGTVSFLSEIPESLLANIDRLANA